jgi:hypothetical protein
VHVPFSVRARWAVGPRGREALYQCGCVYRGQAYSGDECADTGGADGLEAALLRLRQRLQSVGCLQTCFFCKFSDYEPNTSTGHLYCFVRRKEEYCARAAADDPLVRKYHIWTAGYEPVDEFHRCEEFEKRPERWGYRG